MFVNELTKVLTTSVFSAKHTVIILFCPINFIFVSILY
jgi:hypothetical protein